MGHDAPSAVDRRGKNQREAPEASEAKQKADEPALKKKKVLSCTICLEEHYTHHCPLLHGPKPVATFCGLAGDGLGFFHIPTDGAKVTAPPQRMTATALVRIVEGEVPADLLKKELARILPEKWEWVVTEHGKKEFIVPFPSKVELDMLTAIKRVPTDNNEGLLYFEEWSEEIKPKKKLPKVWVHIYGVPHEIRSFSPSGLLALSWVLLSKWT